MPQLARLAFAITAINAIGTSSFADPSNPGSPHFALKRFHRSRLTHQQSYGRIQAFRLYRHGRRRWPNCHLFLPRISDAIISIDSAEDTLRWLVTALNGGQRISVHTVQDLAKTARNLPDSARKLLARLEPWLTNGQMRFGKCQINDEDTLALPRIFSPNLDGFVLYSLAQSTPMLQALLPKPIFEGHIGPAAFDRIQQLKTQTVWWTVKDIGASLPIERFALVAGTGTELVFYFCGCSQSARR